MNNNNSNNELTRAILTLFTCVLVVLKLLKMIDISWWWVFSPVWIPLAVSLGLIVIGALGFFLSAVWKLLPYVNWPKLKLPRFGKRKDK
jgi:hypothetical protein